MAVKIYTDGPIPRIFPHGLAQAAGRCACCGSHPGSGGSGSGSFGSGGIPLQHFCCGCERFICDGQIGQSPNWPGSLDATLVSSCFGIPLTCTLYRCGYFPVPPYTTNCPNGVGLAAGAGCSPGNNTIVLADYYGACQSSNLVSIQQCLCANPSDCVSIDDVNEWQIQLHLRCILCGEECKTALDNGRPPGPTMWVVNGIARWVDLSSVPHQQRWIGLYRPIPLISCNPLMWELNDFVLCDNQVTFGHCCGGDVTSGCDPQANPLDTCCSNHCVTGFLGCVGASVDLVITEP